MTEVKSRFRMAESLEEAMKLLKSKRPSNLKMMRKKKKLWEDGVYENAKHSSERRIHKDENWSDTQLTRDQKTKGISLARVKWIEKEDK